MVTGLLQALTLAGVDIPAHFLVQSYYHSVSLHGVLNVLVWTTFFICGFVPFLASRLVQPGSGRPQLGLVPGPLA